MPRKRESKIVSRIYSVSPKDTERFALRLLLLCTPGATSFKSLRTFEGVRYSSFQAAAKRRNLLLSDTEFENCMREAALQQMPSQLRQTFGQICAFCVPDAKHVASMWAMFKSDLTEDYQLTMSVGEAENRVINYWVISILELYLIILVILFGLFLSFKYSINKFLAIKLFISTTILVIFL